MRICPKIHEDASLAAGPCCFMFRCIFYAVNVSTAERQTDGRTEGWIDGRTELSTNLNQSNQMSVVRIGSADKPTDRPNKTLAVGRKHLGIKRKKDLFLLLICFHQLCTKNLDTEKYVSRRRKHHCIIHKGKEGEGDGEEVEKKEKMDRGQKWSVISFPCCTQCLSLVQYRIVRWIPLHLLPSNAHPTPLKPY